MVEARQEVDLVAVPAHPVARGQLRAEHLERDLAPELRIGGGKDARHAAAADESVDAIAVADGSARREVEAAGPCGRGGHETQC